MYFSMFSRNPYNDKCGIYFYDEKIYEMYAPDTIQSYKVVCCVSNSRKDFVSNRFETIDFIVTCNLKNYIVTDKRVCKIQGNVYETHKLDLERLLTTYHPELLEFVSKRLEFYNKTSVDPTYDEKYEFIEFDQTGDMLAPPFELNGKYGARVYIRNINHNKTVRERLLEPIKMYSKYDFVFKKENWHTLSSNEKENYISSLDELEVCNIYKKILRLDADSAEIDYKTNNYYVYLFGNDDVSYSKYFKTKEDAENELKYLRCRQPVNMIKDIINRSYHFTN